MTLTTGMLLCGVVLLLAGLAVVGNWIEHKARAQGLDRWLPTYLATSGQRRRYRWGSDEEVDVFIAVCDHYEPETGRVDPATALSRVMEWVEHYPRQYARFRDVDGRPPQHTFFFPQDEYRPEYLDTLRPLIEAGYGDVDIHLHHHNDTPDGFREKLEVFRDVLYHRHGYLRTDPTTGGIVYGFIHGNWALCNSRRDGHWCGVDHEIPILLDTGCYADFTFPSAPSDTQPQTINQIYYAVDLPEQRQSHNRGTPAAVGVPAPENSLLMIQGPLVMDRTRRKWGLLPRIENGDLLASHPPRISRLDEWLRANVHVAGRPNWRFVKLHTHGCKPNNLEMWLEGQVAEFHQDLADRHRQFPNFRFHYVTAWEMAQLVHCAERNETAIWPWEQAATSQLAASATGQMS